MKKIIIAIDGYSSCGKSTLAKDLATTLNYRYIDTGAMYRAVTYYFLHNEVDINNEEFVINSLQQIKIDFDYEKASGKQQIILNNKNIEEFIRTHQVANKVSEVSTLKVVREFLVAQQQRMGKEGGIVMDGRDIGTVVFPAAEVKLFLTANEEVRTMRRYNELKMMGHNWTLEEVKKNIHERDIIDTTRKESPLRKATDAIVIDNTNLTKEQQLELAQDIIKEKIVINI